MQVGDWVRVETPGRQVIEGRVTVRHQDGYTIIASEPKGQPVSLDAQTLRNSAVQISTTR